MNARHQPDRELVHLSVRRVPARPLEPPYDDELDPHSPPVTEGTLALAFPLPSGVLAVPEAPARLRLLPPTQEAEGGADRRTPSAPRPWAGRLVQAVVEVLAGDRPVAQLARWTAAGVYFDLQRLATRAARERAVAAGRPAADAVRSLHVSEPADGIAEVCALVDRGRRAHALALRMEEVDGRWQCTALQLG